MPNDRDQQSQRPLEIGSRSGRIGSIVGAAIAILLVAGLLIYLFFRFTGSLGIAATVVLFMLGGMLLMGYLASRQR